MNLRLQNKIVRGGGDRGLTSLGTHPNAYSYAHDAPPRYLLSAESLFGSDHRGATRHALDEIFVDFSLKAHQEIEWMNLMGNVA
jgi:hypothetical protein